MTHSIGPVQRLADVVSREREGRCIPEGIQSSYDAIQLACQRDPDAPALSFFLQAKDHHNPHCWSYQDLLEQVTRCANLFRRVGIQRRDVVAFVLPNLPETHCVIWGAETAGVVLALNPLLEAEALENLMRQSNASWVVTLAPMPGSDLWDKVVAAAPAVESLRGIFTVNPSRHLAGSEGHLLSLWSIAKCPQTLGPLPVLDLHHELEQESTTLQFDAPILDDVASYFCTGGTTGMPKIAIRTHRTELSNAFQLASVFADAMGPGRTSFCGLPLFHVNAQIGSGLAVFARGGHVLLGPPQGYRSEGLLELFWEICETHDVCTFSAVPTIYAALLKTPRNGRPLKRLLFAICGAAPMPVELFQRFQAETGVKIIEGYGLTEAGCVSSINPPAGESRVGSIGLRMPWQSMRTVILDTTGSYLRDAAVDEAGLVVVRGPNLFLGYLHEVHNRDLWIAIAEPGQAEQPWLNTGDLGRIDKDGYFWLIGRSKELIIRGGHNIDPRSIEEAMAAHPDVALSAAVGRPDAHAGEVPVVYVQLREGRSVTEQDLLAHAQRYVRERAAVPKWVRVVPTLPVTAVGKIFKPALLLQEIESVVREEAVQNRIDLQRIEVRHDAQRGFTVHVQISSDSHQVLKEVLGRHAFNSTIECVPEP